MKHSVIKTLVIAICTISSVEISACHNKANDSTPTTNSVNSTSDTTVSAAPVIVSSDTTLQNGVRDAAKDYPGVNASVNDGEITLTGDISREKLPRLMMAMNSLHPKKVNNNLTIK